MKPIPAYPAFARLFVLGALLALGAHAHAQTDPLPSWHDGPAKQAIVTFVQGTTDPDNSKFVPPERRIATFDNDGTLWVEHPLYVQLEFALARVHELAPQHPEWKSTQPFQAILENDKAALGKLTEHDVAGIVMATHAGMTPQQFETIAQQWLETARHPRYKVRYTELVYQPMIELLEYLRANQFKTFIVTGGGIEFVRAIAASTYGIPRWQVVGSRIKNKFELVDGKAQLERLPEIDFIDDGPGKAVGINAHIGLRPIAAFGNSDGDIEMLEYTDSGKDAHIEMMVHHDDPKREYSYGCDTKIGRLCKGVELAKQRGWHLISMKNEWARIFAFEK
jgi:phosphoserine phosphatase